MTRLNEDIAEIAGVLIGDGCISRYKAGKKFRTVMLFTGSWKNDSDYYKSRISKLMLKYFRTPGNIYHRKDDDTIRHSFFDKNIINYFTSLGFPVGKKTNTIRIPDKILKSSKLSIACVRGIFHTDGSVYSRYSKKYLSHRKHYRSKQCK